MSAVAGSNPISPHGTKTFVELPIPRIDLKKSTETDSGTVAHSITMDLPETLNSYVQRLYGGYTDCLTKLIALAVVAHHRGHLASFIRNSEAHFTGNIFPGKVIFQIEHGGGRRYPWVAIRILGPNRSNKGPEFVPKFESRVNLSDPTHGEGFDMGIGVNEWLKWFSGDKFLPVFSGPTLAKADDVEAYQKGDESVLKSGELLVSSGSFGVAPELFLPGTTFSEGTSHALLTPDILCGSAVQLLATGNIKIGTTLLHSFTTPLGDLSLEELREIRTTERNVSFQAYATHPRSRYERLMSIDGRTVVIDKGAGLQTEFRHSQEFEKATTLF